METNHLVKSDHQKESLPSIDNIYKIDLQSLSNFFVYDHNGNRFTIGEIWAEFKTIIFFVRVGTFCLKYKK